MVCRRRVAKVHGKRKRKEDGRSLVAEMMALLEECVR